MSDDTTGPAAPRRPAPSPFYLAVARELGLDPEQVIDGTVRVGWVDDPTTWKGRTGLVEVTWRGRAYLTEETYDRLRATTTTTDAIPPVATTTKRGADEHE